MKTEEKIEKLLAERPSAREVILAITALNAMIGNPELHEAQTDIKLAAMHMQDVLYTLMYAPTADLQDTK